MKLERAIAIMSFVISLVALGVALLVLKHDPLGSDLSTYDLSSPEKTLRSVHSMVAKRDLKAGLQLIQANLLREQSPSIKLFFSEPIDITVLKSVEVENSAGLPNNGLVVSFVKFRVSGVDYHAVRYFRKDQMNRFQLGETFSIPYGTDPNEQDKALQASIEQFEKTGKLQ